VTVLEALDVSKDYREGRGEVVPVLHGVSLGLARGEIVGLEGPSGSGKTTLLSILGCILTPTSGRVLVEGEEADPRRPSRLPAIRRRSIGFVFQQFNLFPSLTAVENVEYALNVKGVQGDEARLEAERVLRAVGLEDRMDFLPRDLSGGQKQRVAIARALAGRSPILLADEPTASLDAEAAGRVAELMFSACRETGASLLLVTHDAALAARCPRVTHLAAGHLSYAVPEPLSVAW
jgi:putative ABC transport system ATP-binding protein